ncbi:unnamed protein product [Brassica rapa subsp. trilocularis]
MALVSVSIGSVGLSVRYRSCSIHCFMPMLPAAKY